LSLQSSAFPLAMRACLTVVGDHLECRCGHRFASEAGFTEVRDHARQCFGKRQVRHLHEPEDPRESAEDIAAMQRLQEIAAAQEIHMWRQRIVACCFNAGNERWGLV
jgi:hypothetical protein